MADSVFHSKHEAGQQIGVGSNARPFFGSSVALLIGTQRIALLLLGPPGPQGCHASQFLLAARRFVSFLLDSGGFYVFGLKGAPPH